LLFAEEPNAADLTRSLAFLKELATLPQWKERKDPKDTRDPELLAMAGLCHVLLGSNRFLYLD